MIKKLFIVGLLLVAMQTSYGQFDVADRIDGSPYPVSATPSTLYVINNWGWSEAKRLTTATLSGLLAKDGSTMIYNESGPGYSIWLKDLVENYGVYSDKTYYNDFTGLITHFKYDFDGYILCDLKDNSTNAAISLCGPMKAVAVTEENVQLMKTLGKSMLLDVRGKDEAWALKTSYSSEFSKDVTSFQSEEKCLFLTDYSVFANAFHFFDSNLNSKLVSDALGRMDDNRIVMGWGPDEKYTVEKISKNSLQINPADWTENLPVLSNFEATLEQHTHATTVNDEDNVHTVCFLVSDGDNFDWLLKEFYGLPKAYGSPNRGKVSIGWSVSPALSELGPTLMKYFYDKATNKATAKDYFVGSTSGMGYMNPDLFPDLQASADLTSKFMKKADLNILNIIGTRYNTADMQKYLGQDNIDAVFYYKYENYAGLNGAIYTVDNKLVIGARYRLWEGFDNAATLAGKLNQQSTDAYSAAGYSLIAVHAWSFGQYVVDEINACVSRLNSNVIVVTPDEFVKRIKKKFGLSSAEKKHSIENSIKVYPNPVRNNRLNIQGELKNNDVVEVVDINGRVVSREIVKVGFTNNFQIDLQSNIRNGFYFVKIIRGDRVITAKLKIQH